MEGKNYYASFTKSYKYFFHSDGFEQSGSSWLKIFTTKAEWSAAKLDCEKMGTRLVVIKTHSKQKEVVKYLSRHPQALGKLFVIHDVRHETLRSLSLSYQKKNTTSILLLV